MLTIKEVANALKVHEMTILRHLNNKSIKGVKIGKSWRISEEELNRIIKEGL